MSSGERRDVADWYVPKWTKDSNILTEESLELAKRTLDEGWICGVHYYYCGGCGGNPVAFNNFSAYSSHIEQSRPGDLFELWSVPEIRRRGLLLVDQHASAGNAPNSLLGQEDLRRILEYFDEGVARGEQIAREILVAVSFGGAELEAIWTDFDGSGWEPLIEAAQRAVTAGGALCVLPFTTIDCDELRMFKGKRPNAAGEVPLGGAY